MDQILPAPPPVTRSASPIIAVAASKVLIHTRLAHPTNYSQRPRAITQAIALHATDGHEGLSKDTDAAAMFAGILVKPRSCHYVVDADSVTQCVPAKMTAWHCGRTGNARTEGVELCGFAKQTREQWLDEMSLRTLCIAASVVAARCRENSLPIIFVNAAALVAGVRGITTHAEISKAWHETNHTDPGAGFPLADFIAAVQHAT